MVESVLRVLQFIHVPIVVGMVCHREFEIMD
jgi:hypothetical protein